MNTIDRYLSAVRTFLPKAQQRDIIDELSGNIHSKIEDEESRLGRPLSEAEQEALLKQLGHPALVAGRYTGEQRSLAFGRQLIGPLLFPLYLRVLSIVMTIGLSLFLLVSSLIGQRISEMFSTLLLQLLVQFGVITLIFSLAQSHLTRHPDVWSPRDPLSPEPLFKDPRYAGQGARAGALFELAILVALFLWLRSVPAISGTLFDGLWLAPVWREIYLPVLLLTLASMASPLMTLVTPAETRPRAALRVAINALWIGLLAYFLSAGPWLFLPTGAAPGELDRLPLLNDAIFYSVLITLGFSAWQLISDLRKLRRLAAAHQT